MDINSIIEGAEKHMNDIQHYPDADGLRDTRVGIAANAYRRIGISCERTTENGKTVWHCYEA